jgi:hypothetical protein
VVDIYNEILVSHNKKDCRKMDETGIHHVKQNKPDSKKTNISSFVSSSLESL